MVKALVAPIPHVHFACAYKEKLHDDDRFAFGTDKEAICDAGIELDANNLDIPVIIYISGTGKDQESVDVIGSEIGYRAVAKLQKITNRQNDENAKRPESTQTDGDFKYYYHLSNLRLLSKAADHSRLETIANDKKIVKRVTFPMWVDAPEDIFQQDVPDEVIAELEEISSRMDENSESQGKYMKFVALANYGLFLTIVWKSFEAGVDIPFVAKVAAFFFGVGIFFSALMYFADYLADRMTNTDDMRRVNEIDEEYGEALKQQDARGHFNLKLYSLPVRFIENKKFGPVLPGFIYEVFYSITSMFAGVVSAISLGVGMFFLWLSVFF